MKITKCSASAIGMYYHCSFAYFLHYILGMETKTGLAALQGSIVHKTLEWMCQLKRRGKTNVDPMWLLDRAWDELTAESPEIAIRRVTTRIDKETGDLKEAADHKKCRVALETILADKHYNPYDNESIGIEQWFAMEMPGEEWECTDKDGNKHQFAARGFIDLVKEIDKETIEIVDWKTGNRKNFHTQEDIDEEVLTKEVQPRLYHLAAYFLYPQYKNIIVTFYYANDGGPVTVAFSQDDLARTVAVLHRFFTTVKQDTLLLRNRHWTCKMCSFNNNGICNRVWSDLNTMGSEYIEDRYTNLTYEGQLAIGKPEEK
ncbi:hypothetical protein LCGC14_0141970 [marine sediment metagenome]|uniref:PD-(D/E)XK endonuclease-like domain-containing protein n=1 Tax=marine sediment metagenome TaxID=412755 RepID=A0A0F9VGJ4_9ZZZZ